MINIKQKTKMHVFTHNAHAHAKSTHILNIALLLFSSVDYVPVKGITRDIEIRNNVTIARGEWEGDSGERGLQELL